MKKTTVIALILLLVLSLLAFSGCSALLPKAQPEILKSYPKQTAPEQVVKTQTGWAMLHNVYGGRDYTVSAGKDLESAITVYSANDVSIWYFEANDNGIVWCEKSTEFYTYKAYVFKTEQVETMLQVPVADGFQPANVGIFGNVAYYCLIDYEKQEVRAIAYDLSSQATNDVYTAAFEEDNQPYFINLEATYLSFACSDFITVLDVQTNQTVYRASLPDDVKHVFSVSYDSKNETCALYYADGDSEDIGILRKGETAISSLFTFSENYYAYHDKIECYNGHVYWIAQANVSGYVTDHYKLIDYNYLEHKVSETSKTIDFCRAGEDIYLLRFNKSGDYTHIDLCKD